MSNYKHVILGGGMVAGYCAKSYVELGGKRGELAIVSADDALPYERPPLSKTFLAGKDTERSNPYAASPTFIGITGLSLR